MTITTHHQRPVRAARAVRCGPRRTLLGAAASVCALVLLAGCGAPDAKAALVAHLNAAFEGNCQIFANTQWFHGPGARPHRLMKSCRTGEQKGSKILHIGAARQHPAADRPPGTTDFDSFRVKIKAADGTTTTSTMDVVKFDGYWLFWK